MLMKSGREFKRKSMIIALMAGSTTRFVLMVLTLFLLSVEVATLVPPMMIAMRMLALLQTLNP